MIACSIAAIPLNFFVLENILIPDPCYYHSRDTTMLFDLFYDLPSFAGYHPVPTIFNFIFTMVIGALTGWVISKYVLKKLAKNATKNS